MADKAKNVVLNFKMSGQVQYAQTLKQINMVMNNASKEYKNHIAAMGRDASATDKLRAEKKKLEIQMEGAQKRTKMLRDEFDSMSKDTKTSADELNKMYGKLLDAERAEIALQKSLDRVNDGLSDQSQESREAQEALDKLKSEAQVLEAEQKKLTSTFKLQTAELDETSSEMERNLLIQKQMSSQMKLTDRAVANLEKQLEASKKIYGENSVEVLQLETRLNSAKSSVNDFKKSLDKLQGSSEKAEKSIDGLGSGMQSLAGAAPAAAIGGLVTTMQEYNEVLARLRTNAATSGRDLAVVEESFTKITAVTGEADAAGETLANLLASGFNDSQLAEVIEQVNGAYIRFSDTLKTEGIADGIQETLAAGEAVGPFAELLERSGIKLDDFNKKLKEAQEDGEGTNLVLKTLTEQGFGDMYSKYQELNPEVQKNAEANAKLQEALAELAIILTPMVTQVAEFTTKLIEWANENPKLTEGIALGAAAIGGLVTALSVAAPIVTAIIGLMGSTGLSIGALVTPIGLAVAAIGLIVTALIKAYNESETFRNAVSSAFENIKNVALQVFEIVASFIGEKIAQIKQFWDENGTQILQACQNVFNGIMEVINFVMPFVKMIIQDAWNAIKNIINGALNVIMGLVKVFAGLFTGDFKKVWEGVKQIFSGAVEAIWGVLQLGFLGKIFKVIKSFSGKAIGAIQDLAGKLKGKFGEIVSSAAEKFNAFKDKALAPVQAAKDKIGEIIEGIKGFFSGLKLEIPKIKLPKLPKFSIDGDFSLNPPSVPKLSVKWNAKGAIFTEPTIAGINRGTLQGFGEAGPEAALPLNEETLGAIGKGIAATMSGNNRPIILQIDGKTFAQITGDYTDAVGGARIRRIERGLA